MPTEIHGRLEIHTYKRGLFSRLAHDLQLSVQRFEIQRNGSLVEAVFWVDSFTVDGVIEKGHLRKDLLSPKDENQILRTIRNDILHTRAHPTVRLTGQIESKSFDGLLDIRGIQNQISFDVPTVEPGSDITVEITPSAWGIKPYKALMGALQLQDKIEARFIFEEQPTSQ